MKRFVFFLYGSVLPCLLFSQGIDSTQHHFVDSVLEGVTVNAFRSRLQWKTVPAAVAVIGATEMNRYANTSLVPVFNTVPGVRMEERSPVSAVMDARWVIEFAPEVN